MHSAGKVNWDLCLLMGAWIVPKASPRRPQTWPILDFIQFFFFETEFHVAQAGLTCYFTECDDFELFNLLAPFRCWGHNACHCPHVFSAGDQPGALCVLGKHYTNSFLISHHTGLFWDRVFLGCPECPYIYDALSPVFGVGVPGCAVLYLASVGFNFLKKY